MRSYRFFDPKKPLIINWLSFIVILSLKARLNSRSHNFVINKKIGPTILFYIKKKKPPMSVYALLFFFK